MVGRSGRARRSMGIIGFVFLVVAACGSGGTASTGAPGGAALPQAFSAPRPAGSDAPPAGQGSTTDTPAGSLIVRTGSLRLEVKDLDGTLPKAREFVAGLGGYVAGSEEVTNDEQQVATITYRIPVARWQDALSGLRALAAKVINETTASEEVTPQVVDLEARLVNFRATETSLRDIMTRASNTAEVLAVQDKLTTVREQIERLTAHKNDLTGRAALATLAATWATPDAPAVAEARSGWDLGREVDRALAQTVSFGQAVASLLVWLALTAIPVFGPILLLVGMGIWFYRRWAAKRPPRIQHPGWGPPPGMAMAGPSWVARPAAGAMWGTAPSAPPRSEAPPPVERAPEDDADENDEDHRDQHHHTAAPTPS